MGIRRLALLSIVFCIGPTIASLEALTEKEKDLHLLLRASFGPTAEQLETIATIGRQAWLEQQLHPGTMAKPEYDAILRRYPSLTMDANQLVRTYIFPENGQQAPAGKEFWRPYYELQLATVRWAVSSEAQLQEVMADFWFNHFNVYGPEAVNFWGLTPYVMKAIRDNALGNFPDLLMATAESPAMLYYLDNFQSTRTFGLGTNPRSGLNENYARELMELHTLGVDAGYSQQDVINAAKILTGWTFTNPYTDKTLYFIFNNRNHEPGSKKVFGKKFAESGVQEGYQLIEYLASRPETANHIATKLVARFVSDQPPKNLVKKVKNVYLNTGGNIRAMIRAIFNSNAFYKDQYFRTKVKSPLEYFASVLRITNSAITQSSQVPRFFDTLGQPLFRSNPPTGYPDYAEGVTSAGIFLAANQIATALANDELPGITMKNSNLNSSSLTGTALAMSLMDQILVVSEDATFDSVINAAQTDGFGFRSLVGLVLMTPDFLSQ